MWTTAPMKTLKCFQDNIFFICKNYSKFKTKYTQVKEIVFLRGALDFGGCQSYSCCSSMGYDNQRAFKCHLDLFLKKG